MTIIFMGENAFVDVGKGYLICVGTRKAVEAIAPEKLLDLIREAIAIAKYEAITTSKYPVM